MRCDTANGAGTIYITNAEMGNVLANANIAYDCPSQALVTVNTASTLGAANCNGSNINESGARFPTGC